MKSRTYGGSVSRRRAMSLVEVMIGATILGAIGASIMFLMVSTARRSYVSTVEYQVNQYANLLQDRISVTLRSSSRRHGVLAYSPTDDSKIFFRSIRFKKTELSNPPDPVRELTYDLDNKTLNYDPDITENGDEEVWGLGKQGGDRITLDECMFRRGMKPGGIPDSSTILVYLEVSDHGKARQSFRDPDDEFNWITATRAFAVNLRRE